MIINNLYNNILIEPVTDGFDTLFAISGYASATFARRHVTDLLTINKEISINLIIGMPRSLSDHAAFLKLHEEFKGKFSAYYYKYNSKNPPIHSKIFTWKNHKNDLITYSGSANYSQYGFIETLQANQMVKHDFPQSLEYFNERLDNSIYIPEVKLVLPKSHDEYDGNDVAPGTIRWEIPDKRVTISFLDKSGDMPTASGINWGQRREKRIDKKTNEVKYVIREPNQAYLSIKGDARNVGFLPERGLTFSLITDDGFSFDCVVAQDGRKAIQSTNDNSELGRYLRKRLNVSIGEFVNKDDLIKYGRTSFTIEKLNDETFLLDLALK